MMDPRDRISQGDPETVVLLPTGSLLGLLILESGFGHVILGIREDEYGQPVRYAVTNELRLEYPPAQSNPRRWIGRE